MDTRAEVEGRDWARVGWFLPPPDEMDLDAPPTPDPSPAAFAVGGPTNAPAVAALFAEQFDGPQSVQDAMDLGTPRGQKRPRGELDPAPLPGPFDQQYDDDILPASDDEGEGRPRKRPRRDPVPAAPESGPLDDAMVCDGPAPEPVATPPAIGTDVDELLALQLACGLEDMPGSPPPLPGSDPGLGIDAHWDVDRIEDGYAPRGPPPQPSPPSGPRPLPAGGSLIDEPFELEPLELDDALPVAPSPSPSRPQGSPTRALPIGPPKGGKRDTRKTATVASQGTGVMDARFAQYTVEGAPGAGYLKRRPPRTKDTRDYPVFDEELEKAKAATGGPGRPIYEHMKAMTRATRAAEAGAKERLLDFLDGMNKAENKRRVDDMVRDDATALPGEVRKTGRDETMQTSGFGLAVARDAGLDPAVYPTLTTQDGAELGRLDFHEHLRTETKAIPLEGGPDFYHPGTATKEPGGTGFHQIGNKELDEARMAAIMAQNRADREASAAMIAQVRSVKRAADTATAPLVGYDTTGADLASDAEARRKLTFRSGQPREVMKKAARVRSRVFPDRPGSPVPDLTPLSPADPNFSVSTPDVERAWAQPRRFADLLGTGSAPLEVPPGWAYNPALRAPPAAPAPPTADEPEIKHTLGDDDDFIA